MRNLFRMGCAALAAAMMTGSGFAAEAETPVKSLKVLMIGNSFSICVLKEMPKIAAELGLQLDLCSLYIGGCSLERHMQNVKDPGTRPYKVTWSYASVPEDQVPLHAAVVRVEEKGGLVCRGNIPAMLSADRWDVVTVQQASHFSWQPATYEPFGSELLRLIGQLAPQARVYVQQTWSYTPWDSRLAGWGIDPKAMFGAIEGAYRSFARKHDLPQILMGKAVQRYREELPVVYTEKSNDDDVCGTSAFEETDGTWRPKGDVFHLNARGEFLQALVWTARLFGADVTRSTYVPESLKAHPERAELMRRIAVEVAAEDARR